MALGEKKIEEVYTLTSKSLNSIYKKRKFTLLFQRIMWILAALFFIILGFFISSQLFPDKHNFILDWFRKYNHLTQNQYLILYLFMGFSVVLTTISYLFSYFFKIFKKKERKTIAVMINNLFPNFSFTKNFQLKTKELRTSKLFPWLKIGTPLYTYGYIKTKIENVALHISDIGIIEENLGNKFIVFLSKIPLLNMLIIFYIYFKNIFTSKTADGVFFTFRGIFCWADFNKNLKGTTVLIPNKMNSKINRALSLKFKEEEKILLEDIRFVNHFTVYGTDQIEARYVLSTSMLEKIVELKEKFNRDVMLSFSKNKLFLTIENPNGIFSFPLGKLDSIKIIEELVSEINTLQNIVTDFNLNRKSLNQFINSK